MNKQFFRTKFNAKLGTYVAVSELAKSHQGDTSPRIKSLIKNDIKGSDTFSSEAQYGKRTLKQLVLALSSLMVISPIYANVVVNKGAAAAHQAVVLKQGNAANVWITAPTASGVSRNSYTQFDVNQNGVILNNSRAATLSKITNTTIAANPNLARGAATTIVNEVVSTNPSLLQGNLEVLGSRANVIIANPSGITVNGGGFINANQVTLSTGALSYNSDGSIKDHTIKQGAITVNPDVSKRGLGGNANNPIALELLGRSIVINAPVNATTITAISGANTISATSDDVVGIVGAGIKPTFAIDVAQLGGLYANSIYLHANENGVGVKNAGVIQAQNNLILNSNGKIEHSGTISSTSKTQGLVSINTTGAGAAGDINSSGSINSNSMIIIDSSNNLNVNAKEIIINNGSLAASPLTINTKGNLNLAANSRIFNDAQSGAVYVDAANINLATNAGITSNRGSAYIQSQKDVVAAQGAKLIAAQDLNVSGKGKLSLIGNALQASLGSINLQATSSDAQGLIDIQAGTIYAGKDLNLYSSEDINLKNLGLTVETSTSRVKNINAYSGRNLGWDNTGKVMPQITGKVQLDVANQLDLIGSSISTKDDINLKANKLNLRTDLSSQKNIDIVSKVSDLSLEKGLTAQGDIQVSALTGGITTTSLKAQSTAGKVAILANKNLIINSSQAVESAPGADKDGLKTDITVIKGQKGVTLGSVGDGNVQLKSAQINADQGEIQLLAGNGLSLLANTDVTIRGDNGYDNVINNVLQGQSIQLQNKKADVDIRNSNFTTTVGNLVVNSEGKATLKDSELKSKTNLEISGKGQLDINNSKTSAEQHIALSSKEGVSIANNNIYAKGVFSLTATKDINLTNDDVRVGAALIETGGRLNTIGYSKVEAREGFSGILSQDTPLKDLNGNLSIQTNGALIIDPKKINLGGSGDIDIRAKNGELKLLGYESIYGFKPGFDNAVEPDLTKAVWLYTSKSINLEGTSVDIQSTNLKAITGINISATQGDLRIDGVKQKVTGKSLKPYQLSWEPLDPEKFEYFKTPVVGEENYGSIFNTLTGNINLSAKKGVSITGSNLEATLGQVNIQAQGVLGEQYKTTAFKEGTASKTMNASIIIDGNVDVYEKGTVNDANYSYKEFINPTTIEALRGVNIRAMGKSVGDNLILQGTSITTEEGDVNIEANKNILFDVALETSYDRTTKTETKRSWYGKKKTTTTTSVGEVTTPASVDIYGKNINILSEFKNPVRADGTKDPALNTSIDLYSSRLTADGGKITIRSGGDLNFLSVPEIRNSNVNTVKKSSWLGITLGKSKTNATRNQVTSIPAKLKADYIGTKAGYDTKLEGTEFTYLKSASIESGGKIVLTAITDRVAEATQKQKSSVVWQSTQDKGSITETAKMPSFNGPVAPVFKAAGGLSVQVPVNEQDANKKELREEILKLSNQPGNTYLKELVNRKDVDWQTILLTQNDWNYKSQGLTGAGAALIVIIVTIATMGTGTAAAAGAAGGTAAGSTTVGLGASMLGTAGVTTTAAGAIVPSTLGVMANAAVTSLATQASVSLVNNRGDIGKTLKDLGSSDSVKNLAASVVTAGLLSQVGSALNLKPDSTLLPDRLMNNFTSSVGSTLVQTAIKGGNLEDNLQTALLAGLAGALQGELASQIGTSLDKVDPNIFEYTVHKIAHAAVGCAAAAATKSSCEAGAIGAGIGEIIAELMIPEGKTALDLTDDERTKIKDTSKIVAGVTAAFAGYDVNTAANSANVAVENNSLGKLATTAGKAAYRVAKTISNMPASVRANLKPSEVIEMLRKEGVQGVIDIGDNFVTLVSPTSSMGDRAFALIDLAIGIDLKAAKNIDALKVDRDIISKNVSILEKRPTHKASEIDVGKQLGTTALPQVSYKGGQVVPYGTPGSVRPDFSIGNTVGVEVKNYNIANNSSGLISNVSKQVITRAEQLPKGMQQQIIIDIRGQTVTDKQKAAIVSGVVAKTNGLIFPSAIRFKNQ
ncbi:DUF637 domain-containing protein [Acinetobacter baumannii]